MGLKTGCENEGREEFTMAELRNTRVLIVDNNEQESGRLGVILQRAGFDSIATWSGIEALKLLKSGEYDIMLVSSYLPDVYVGDFFERVNRLPVRPCSIVMREGCTPAAALLEVRNVVVEDNCQAK
jgi:CheY-like chemotaxis protein